MRIDIENKGFSENSKVKCMETFRLLLMRNEWRTVLHCYENNVAMQNA